LSYRNKVENLDRTPWLEMGLLFSYELLVGIEPAWRLHKRCITGMQNVLWILIAGRNF